MTCWKGWKFLSCRMSGSKMLSLESCSCFSLNRGSTDFIGSQSVYVRLRETVTIEGSDYPRVDESAIGHLHHQIGLLLGEGTARRSELVLGNDGTTQHLGYLRRCLGRGKIHGVVINLSAIGIRAGWIC
jgi:hypothetical protein